MGSLVRDVAEMARWVAGALTSSGYGADFSPGSLWEIDRFFDENAADGAATPGGLLSEGLGQRLFALGGYVGEVIRRSVGGRWAADDDDPDGEINIRLLLGTSTIWPVHRVMQRFWDPADGLAAYGAAMGVPVGSPPSRGRPQM